MVSEEGLSVVPDCTRCIHHIITHDSDRPRGCRAYGFACREVPSAVVERESGMPCEKFEARPIPGRGADPSSAPNLGPKRRPRGGLYG